MGHFKGNMDIVLFVYGLSFFIMGIAVLVQPKKESKYYLASILWLLAAFGITHGIYEFLGMWTIIKGKTPVLELTQAFCLVISFLFLFEFGRRLVRKVALERHPLHIPATILLDWRVPLAIGPIIFILNLESPAVMDTNNILARYFLGFPGSVLAGLGLLFYYEAGEERFETLKVKPYLISSGIAFLVYGVLCGLTVDKGNFLSSAFLATDLFLSAVGVPVQVFRAVCAVIIAVSINRILIIFNAEITDKLKSDITRIKQADDSLRHSYEYISTVLDNMNDSISILNINDFSIADANSLFLEELGIKDKSEVIGRTCYAVTHNRHYICSSPDDSCPLSDVVKNKVHKVVEHVYYDKNGEKKYVEVSASPITDKNGEVTQVINISRDISERKKASEEMEKVNRALRTLSKCNAALIHSSDEQVFLNEICRIIVEDGKYLMTWIGYPQSDKEKTVLPVAYAGQEAGYLSAAKVTWKDDEWGRGPTGTAIRTGTVCVQNNRLDDPIMAPWREEAAKRGFASAISLPLMSGGECLGALTIFSSTIDIFIEHECVLLKELADNIAYGITAMRTHAKNRLAEKWLRASNEELRNLAAHLQSIREDERTNIAREIHDELGQTLTALKIDLSWFRDKYGDHSQILDKIQSMLDILNVTIQTVKRICTELRPSLLDDFGIVAAMEWQSNEFQKRTGIKCTVSAEPEDIELDKDRSTALFRIFQEALTNILKHAQATNVITNLKQSHESVILEVIDNGKGIKEGQLSKPQSFGLIGMRERVHPWGGVVAITGDEGRSTMVKVSMPLTLQ